MTTGIPFTQYLLPDGRARSRWIDRPEDIQERAQRFIEAGGCFECEMLTTGEISLTAVKIVEGERQDVAIRICQNGPDVPIKVDELVCEVAP